MEHLLIILLSLFAALGIAYLVAGIAELIVFGSGEDINRVELRVSARGSSPLLPYSIRRLVDKCACSGAKVELTVVDCGLSLENSDALMLSIPEIKMIKGQEDA